MCIHCEKIPTTELTRVTSDIYPFLFLFFLVRMLMFYSLNKFQLCDTVFSTVVAMLCIRS